MKYMLMICDDPSHYEGEAGQKLLSEVMAGHWKLHQDLNAAGIEFNGFQLQPTSTATTVRTKGSVQTLHDGAFAETHEELGGYYIIDVPDLDAAIAWAKRIPMPGEGSVEVRPVVVRD